jgi:3-hydroxyisobutyrate dehydrogenase
LVASAGREALLIDCSTIDSFDARALHELVASRGRHSLDAPVSGGVVGATAGTLTFMVGGAEADVRRAEPLLYEMGRRIVHCGEGGTGQAAKACNNMLLGISMIGVGEAFVLAERLGLSHQALFDVASTSSGACWSLTTNCPVPGLVPTSPADDDYRAGFSVNLMLKDLRLARNAAIAGGAVTELGMLATDIYERLAADGAGDQDFSTVYRAIRAASRTADDEHKADA